MTLSSRAPHLRAVRPAIAATISAGVLFIGLLTLSAGILPRDAFFSGDPGVKLLQVEAARRDGPLRARIAYPAIDLDPGREFVGTFLLPTDGGLLGVFPPLLPAATAPLLAWFGLAGLYVLPALGAAIVLLAAHSLARPGLPPGGALAAAWLATVATPVIFYGAEFWEHAPAAALTTAAAVAAAAGGARRWAAAGALVGLAAAFRPECLLMAPALCSGAVAARGRRAAARDLLPLLLGLAGALAPQAAWNLRFHGSALPIQVAFNLARGPGWAEASRQALDELVLPEHGRIPCLLTVIAVAAGALVRRRRHPRLAGLAIVTLLAVTLGAPAVWIATGTGFGSAFGYRSLAHTWPLLALLVFPALLGLGDTAEDAARDRFRFLAASGGAFLLLVLLLTPVPGGFQWGARLLLPAAPILAIAACIGARALLREPFPGLRLVAAGVVAAALAVQVAGVLFLARSKLLYQDIQVALAQATDEGEPILSDLPWLDQVAAPLYPRRRFLLLPEPGSFAIVAERAAVAGFPHLSVVVSAQEGRGSAPEALTDRAGTVAYRAEAVTDLGGRGLRLQRYRRELPTGAPG